MSNQLLRRLRSTNKPLLFWIFLWILALASCKEEKVTETKTPELMFESRIIADSAKLWWAHTPSDLTGDGISDLVVIHNNASGGYLGYYKGRNTPGKWELHTIAEAPPTGGLFASGDLECEDLDGDGDMDVIGVRHPGEWTDAGAIAELFWYENSAEGWISHSIGTAPDAVKDVSFDDFDKDGKMDLAILTFDEHTLSIFQQKSSDDWARVQYIQNEVLHEGMDTGDINGDGYPDIIANGLLYLNPAGELEDEWKEQNLDEQWNNQTGDWSRNGTKTFVRDLDGDDIVEIFMAHSERAGYPLVMYKNVGNQWQQNIISDSIAACHTLQVYDFDLDGDYDVLAGVNKGRAVNLNKTNFDVTLFINQGNNKNYRPMVLEKEGIYNGQVIDYDGDGDMDIFRYPNHEATDFYLMENRIIHEQ